MARKARKDRVLAERLVALSRETPRYGYRRAWALLRREGWKVNKKRVHRLGREEGLKVPEKQRKRRRLAEGGSENGCTRKRARHKDHVWSYYFVVDRTEDGCTRECLALEVERAITAEEVVKTLAALFAHRGEPAFIRSDNGPEFIAKAVKRGLEVLGVRTLYIEPGSPWENAYYSETFISRFGDELLKREVFANLPEAKVLESRSIGTTTTTRGPTAPWDTGQAGRVCGIVRAGRRRRRPYEGARIGNRTLIAAGTENGVRSCTLKP